MRPPPIEYTRVGGSFVAYSVFGEGDLDLVCQAGFYAHLGQQWYERDVKRFLERLASFARVICFDRRGHGMSDDVADGEVTLEHWMEDLTAVMNVVGSERAALVGANESGATHILFAATYPERTSSLTLINTSAAIRRTDDYPIGVPDHIVDGLPRAFRAWILGRNDIAPGLIAPGLADSERWRESVLRMLRYSMSPNQAAHLIGITVQNDVRDVLPSVRVPTLVMHRVDQPFTRASHGRYIAEHIDGAKYLELPGDGLLPWMGDQETILDEIEEFVTGVRPKHEPDRVLSTVLFTDVVSSTERAIAAGDRKWIELLESHNRVVRRALDAHRGREISTAGDGFLASFDGPARAVRCAQAIVEGVRELGLEVRAGLHTGEVELTGAEIGGIAVHIGRRVSDLAGPGEVLVSRTVVDLVAGSGLSFADRGSYTLKGVPGEMQLYAVAR